jgi:hypothetical protein
VKLWQIWQKPGHKSLGKAGRRFAGATIETDTRRLNARGCQDLAAAFYALAKEQARALDLIIGGDHH